jgi:GntR family transcriptional regulator
MQRLGAMAKKAAKYERIKDYLTQGIISQNFTDMVPSENQLAEIFGVSRMTARRALDDLEREGSVKRIPGKGTFVRNSRHYTRGFFRVRPFHKWADDLNADLSTKVLKSSIIDPPEAVRKKLLYDDQVILLHILNYFDDRPVRLAIQYLRADKCAGILWENLEDRSIHDILINTYRLPLNKISQSMTAIGLPAKYAALFGEPEGYPIFYFKRLIYSYESPVTYVEYYMRGDMAFKDTFTPEFEKSDFNPSGQS